MKVLCYQVSAQWVDLQLLTVAEWLPARIGTRPNGMAGRAGGQPSTSTGLLTKRWLYERLIGIESVVCGGLPVCQVFWAGNPPLQIQ